VLDPFMGSGTTAEVAAKLGRDYVGCEISREFIDLGRVKAVETGVPVAEQRNGQMALFAAAKNSEPSVPSVAKKGTTQND